MQTECPNCHTLFRITEAQLAMAEGRVRCGYCKEVFDALVKNDFSDNNNQPDVFNNSRQTDVNKQLSPDYTYFSGEASKIDPDDFSGEISSGHVSTAATAAWSLAILVLIAALTAEYIWFNQPELLQHTSLEPIAEKLCELTDCERVQKRDPTQIEMISRNVYTHPNARDALMVSTTLVNHASYAQPYPDVQIDFSNVRGELVASRRFAPEEYLQLDNETTGLLQSGSPVTFGLEIKDPGKEAITYEFSFH